MSFFRKIQNGLARFLYGRYGSDQFNLFLCGVAVAMYVASLFCRRIPVLNLALYYLPVALWIFILVRTLSKNLDRRRRENAWFLSWWGPVQGGLRQRKARAQDKEHKYFTCKGCGTVCRVPRGRGKIVITCPKCQREIKGKS